MIIDKAPVMPISKIADPKFPIEDPVGSSPTNVNKILLVNIGFVPESLGGTEFYSYNLARELVKQGKEVTVFAAIDDLSIKRYSVQRSMLDGIHVVRIANSHQYARKYEDFFIDHTIAAVFEELLSAIQPDVIHFQHLALLSGNLPEIAQRFNIPTVMTLHDYWMVCFRSRFLRFGHTICPGANGGKHCATCDDGTPHPTTIPKFPNIVQYLNRPNIKQAATKAMALIPQKQIAQIRAHLFGATQSETFESDSLTLANNQHRFDFLTRQLNLTQLLISPSNHLKERYEQEGVKNIAVIPLGFRPVEPLHPLPFKGKLRLAFIGSIERHKGVKLMLDELLRLFDENLQLTVDIYGHAKDPIYGNEVKAQAQSFPKGAITFHGAYRSDQDLRQILKNSHLIIFPSIWEENHPLVIRETLLHGRPIIASNLGGVTEIVEHSKNGLLFNPFQKGDLANQVKSLFSKPNLLNTLTDEARKTKIEKMENHLTTICDIYEQLLVEKL